MATVSKSVPISSPAATKQVNADVMPKSTIDNRQVAMAYEQYSDFVAQLATRLLGRDHQVEDIVQDVFMAAMNGLHKLQNPDALKAWLRVVTIRTVFRMIKRRRFLRLLSLDDESAPVEIALSDQASEEQRAFFATLYQALEKLPANERMAWTLHYIEGDTLEEIAAISDCSTMTVKRRLAIARNYLEAMLNK